MSDLRDFLWIKGAQLRGKIPRRERVTFKHELVPSPFILRMKGLRTNQGTLKGSFYQNTPRLLRFFGRKELEPIYQIRGGSS